MRSFLATNFYTRVKSLAYKTSVTIRSNRTKGYKTLLFINIEHRLLITPKIPNYHYHNLILQRTFITEVKVKVQQFLYRHTTGPEGSKRLRFPDFETVGT